MFKKRNIQKSIAVLLVAVFALAVCPRIFVHDCFASHTDVGDKLTDSKKLQLNYAGFNCQCDDLVAESNFLGSFISSIFTSFQAHIFLNQPAVEFISVSSFFIDLRGPPNKILNS